MSARWYDPSTGLWTQPDTLVPNPLDPLTFAAVAAVLGLAGLAASYFPARRAAAVDPIRSLRAD